MPQWTKQVVGQLRDQELEYVEARRVCTKNSMWKSTHFFGLGETEGRGAITIISVGIASYFQRTTSSDGCPVVPSLRATVRLEKAEQTAHVADWRHRWLSSAYGAPDGECDRITSANLTKCNKLGVEVKGLAGKHKEETCGSLGVVHFGGKCKSVGYHG